MNMGGQVLKNFWPVSQRHSTPSGKEGKAAVQTKPAKAALIDESPKKSIHARLQEKKKEIAQKPGKDSPQKGVELAW